MEKKEARENFEFDCDELRLFAENTGELYPYVRKAVGVLAKAEASYTVKLDSSLIVRECLEPWVHICTLAARMYRAEVVVDDGDRLRNFNSDVIRRTAIDWASDYLERLRFGEQGLYDAD